MGAEEKVIKKKIQKLEAQINWVFKKKAIIQTALTHSSFTIGGKKSENNERLEFFGDAVLKLCISEYLFMKYKKRSEGELTTMRSYLVSDKVLAKLAQNIQLQDYILIGPKEKRINEHLRSSILANTFEALLGACYFDKGLTKTKQFLIEQLEQLDVEEESIQKDTKTQLQEYLHQKKEPLPIYSLIKEEGPEHNKLFFIQVKVTIENKNYIANGTDKTKKEAEQQAAKQMLSLLQVK